MAHHQDFGCVEIVLLRNLWDVAVCSANVFEGAGPASGRVADAAVLDVPGGNSFGSQRGAEVSGVGQIVFGAPVASMDRHHYRERAFGFGKANVSELIGIGPIRETGIGWGWWESENIFGGHQRFI